MGSFSTHLAALVCCFLIALVKEALHAVPHWDRHTIKHVVSATPKEAIHGFVTHHLVVATFLAILGVSHD